jgi:hypothetical protein
MISALDPTGTLQAIIDASSETGIMSLNLAIPLFAAMFVLAIVRAVCVDWIIRRLQLRHAPTYQAIGSPSRFWNNAYWPFLKFLWGSRWQILGDRKLAIIVRLAQIALVVIVVVFVTLFVAL